MILTHHPLIIAPTKYVPIEVKTNFAQTAFGFGLTGLAFTTGFILNTFVLDEGKGKIIAGCFMFLLVIAGIFIAFQAEQNKQERIKAEKIRKSTYLETEEHEKAVKLAEWVEKEILETVSVKAARMLLRGEQVILLSSQEVKLIEAADDQLYLFAIRK
jgi:hypothetical protein